jgi:hypothetical protein
MPPPQRDDGHKRHQPDFCPGEPNNEQTHALDGEASAPGWMMQRCDLRECSGYRRLPSVKMVCRITRRQRPPCCCGEPCCSPPRPRATLIAGTAGAYVGVGERRRAVTAPRSTSSRDALVLCRASAHPVNTHHDPAKHHAAAPAPCPETLPTSSKVPQLQRTRACTHTHTRTHTHIPDPHTHARARQ